MQYIHSAGLSLEGGGTIAPVIIAFDMAGALNHERSNCVLVFHALTGDQYVGRANPATGRPPWWSRVVGPGRILDTTRFCVLCVNVLGGCMGSTGPSERDAAGRVYGAGFPVITIPDMVRAQMAVLDHLGIARVMLAIGGSMGGMLALQMAADFPDRAGAFALIATAARHSAQNIAFYELGRQAIMSDPDWRGGAYAEAGTFPRRGLALARMAAHITYLSDEALHRKFGRALQARDAVSYGFEADFEVESYLRHQGERFVDRFDANSYLYITRAMDYFDLAAAHHEVLANAFRGARARFCVFSFSSDWHYPPAESKALARALVAAGADVSYVETDTDKGHDAFLLEEPEFERALAGFVNRTAALAGIAAGISGGIPGGSGANDPA